MKSNTSSTRRKQQAAFPWFGLPAKAKSSRWWGLVGYMISSSIMFGIYWMVNEFSAARGVTVFDPAQLFVVSGGSLDSRIPYLPWTVLIYVYVYKGIWLLTVFTYPKTESGVRELFQLYNSLFILTFAACVVFIVCPAEMTLRAATEYQNSSTLLHEYNLYIREWDRPFNTWPSLHIAWILLIILVVTRWLGRRRWTVLLWIAWTAMAISTLTTKQHFIWDLITGSLLALAYWQWKMRKRKA